MCRKLFCFLCFCGALTGFLLSGCERKIDTPEVVAENNVNDSTIDQKNNESRVVVMVNGEAITREDVDFAISQLVGPESAADMDDEARKKILESLVMSRAMSQAQSREMTDQDEKFLNQRLALFREDYLVKQYLAKHTSPPAITASMVREYYDAHLELFGQRVLKEYEGISTSRPLTVSEQSELLKTLEKIKEIKDWKSWTESVSERNLPVIFLKGLRVMFI